MRSKRFHLILCFLFTVLILCAQSTEFETATEAVKNMKVGWNLGNTFDSHKISVTGVTETETMRSQPVTQPELMEMMKMAGFNAIRVPVTWYPHMNASGNIDNAWMKRIREVVDYVISQDMYCIINVHHDTGKTDSSTDSKKGWLRAKRENYAQNKETFEKIWQQIATEFKDYNQLLLFEGYNELLDTLDSWNYPSYNTEVQAGTKKSPYDADVAQSAYDAVNGYASSFVQTVRATGGNNTKRNLILNTYAACDARSPGYYNKEPFIKMQKPENSNHIIFGIHTYPPITDKNEDGVDTLRSKDQIQEQIDYMLSNVDTFFVQRYGAPVIFGEWGTANVDSNPTDYDTRKDYMFEFVDYFVKQTKEKGLATFYWMGLSNKESRALPAFNQADLAERILKAYYGNDYEPNLITEDDYERVYYNVLFSKQWAELTLAKSSEDLRTNYKAIQVNLAETLSVKDKLSFRGYFTDGTNQNYNDIISTINTLNFNSITKPIQRIAITWRSTGSPSIKIKNVFLIKKDDTKEEVVPTNYTASCIISTIFEPKYIKAKISGIKYATLYYGDKNLSVPPYVTASAYKVEGNRLQKVKAYNTGEVIPAGTGVVLNTTEGDKTYKFSIADTNGEPATGNMLRGSDEATTTTGGDKYYMLSLNQASEEGSVGFYYGVPNGGAFTNGAHKAYLALPTYEAKAISYLFNETDGIKNIDATAASDTIETDGWYTIDGKHLLMRPAKKGIYIHHGKKVVIK